METTGYFGKFRNVERIFPLVVLLATSVSFEPRSYATNEFAEYAASLAASGTIAAQPDEDSYRFSDAITRAEMVKIAVKLS